MGRNMREYRAEMERRLVVGFALLLLLVGDGLILFIYGPAAAVSGLLCILAGLALLGLLWLLMWLIDRLSRRLDV